MSDHFESHNIRALFLKVRAAYLQQVLRDEGTIEQAVDAVNIHDRGQAVLISMTPPNFGDGTVTRDIEALLAAAKPEPAEPTHAR